MYAGDELLKFKDRLDGHIRGHDKEIERMCNYHYQGFIDSIRELLKVRTDAAKLKVSIELDEIISLHQTRKFGGYTCK